MTRPLRIDLPGAVHHVMARGDNKGRIFFDDHDCAAFLGTFQRTLARYEWSCLSWCLMVNHYHLVVQTHEPTLSRGMQHLNTVYAQHVNERHERVGHVFQGRFVSTLNQQDEHLLATLRYVARNPVAANLSCAAEAWPWTSYRELALGEPHPAGALVDQTSVLGFFADRTPRARARFAELVAEPYDESPLDRDAVVLGDRRFERATLPDSCPGDGIPRAHWTPGRPDVAEIIVSNTDRELLVAHDRHNYRMRELAQALGCHEATVSRRIKAARIREAHGV